MGSMLDSSKVCELLLPGARACEEAFNKERVYWVYGEVSRARSFSIERSGERVRVRQSFDGPYTRSYELARPWGSGENGKLIHVSGSLRSPPES